MAVDVIVPQSGESIREVQIGAWRKSEGDRVAQDEVLVQIETDKAAMDLPAPVSGVLKAILKKEGEDAKVGDVRGLDLLLPEPAAIYVMDRGYHDFARLYRFHQAAATFVVRDKSNTQFRRRYSRPTDRDTGIICDQTIVLSGRYTPITYPAPLRRIKARDPEANKSIVLLTNNFELPAATIAELYRRRWQIELFFKWIKQHLRIKAFFGTSQNAVKTQVWIAIAVYVLVAIVKKRLNVQASLHTILQILSLALFEKQPLDQLLAQITNTDEALETANQLNLFPQISGH